MDAARLKPELELRSQLNEPVIEEADTAAEAGVATHVRDEKRKRIVAIVLSLLVTSGMGLVAFTLGAWGFGYRRFSTHQQRLERLLQKKPRMALVSQALNEEGSPLIASPTRDTELERVAAQHGGASAQAVLAKARSFAHTRVFRAGDMVYFIYFDSDELMRDFVCVSR